MIPLKERVKIRREMREVFRHAVIKAQEPYLETHKPEDIVPELIATLVDLAYFLAKNNAGIDRFDFLKVCTDALDAHP